MVVKGPMANEVWVLAKTTPQRFSVEYKLKLPREAKPCALPDEVGTLLRREGSYSSNASILRAQRERGELLGLEPKRREPASKLAKSRAMTHPEIRQPQ